MVGSKRIRIDEDNLALLREPHFDFGYTEASMTKRVNVALALFFDDWLKKSMKSKDKKIRREAMRLILRV